jgi:hypothetical protein
MSGNFVDNILDMEVRVQLQRAQQGWGVQVSKINPDSTLTNLGTLTGQGDMQYIGEWLKQGLTLQVTRVVVTGVQIPPDFDTDYGIPQSNDGA